MLAYYPVSNVRAVSLAQSSRERDSRNHINHKFSSRSHSLLEEVHNDGIEPLFQSRKPPKSLLQKWKQFNHYQGRGFVTHDLCQKLPKNPDQLVIYKLTTLQTRLFQSLDLLLYDDLESSGTHKQRWGIALHDRG